MILSARFYKWGRWISARPQNTFRGNRHRPDTQSWSLAMGHPAVSLVSCLGNLAWTLAYFLLYIHLSPRKCLPVCIETATYSPPELDERRVLLGFPFPYCWLFLAGGLPWYSSHSCSTWLTPRSGSNSRFLSACSALLKWWIQKQNNMFKQKKIISKMKSKFQPGY